MKTAGYGVVMALLAVVCGVGCGGGCAGRPAQSASGIKTAAVGKVDTDEKGHTIEQRNVIERIQKDNDLAAIKHLYVISAYSGQVILYSPVRGKVTSGGKSLTPKAIRTVNTTDLPVLNVNGTGYYTDALPNEDGTYGSGSSDYVYWFTPSGAYHQHYLSGGQIVHISDHPVAVKGVIISVEEVKK